MNDASAWINTNWFVLSDASHYIELDWRAATTVGANDGGLTLWIDGTQQADLTGMDNDTWRVDRARLGALSSLDAGTSGTYYFDAFESRRNNYIGPMALAPSMHFASYKFVPAQQSGSLILRQAQDIAFTPADDAYIASASSTTNYGSATTLQVDNSPVKHFLLKFDVTGINGQTITNAKIRLYNVDAASEGGDFYHIPDDSWQEETITWNNAPAAETTLLASLGSVSANTWYEVDMTSLITGDGTYSFRISDSVGGADYSSKEGTNDPELVLTLGGTPVATNTPTNTPTPGPSPTPTNTPTATHTPSATATTPPPAPFNSATFVYDGDGRRVKSIFNGTTTTYFVSAHYEVTGSTITKYYYAGSQRIAMRTNGTLNYLLGDHLGSTSLTTNASGQVVSELRYNAWGEARDASGNTPTQYQYTGQYSHASDFGLLFYQARWYDPSLGRFAQADTIIPRGVQGLDRYAYVNNSPINHVDPNGHEPKGPGSCYAYNWSTGKCGTLGVEPNSGEEEEENDETDNPNLIDIFKDMADEEDIAFNYPRDGCYARAHFMKIKIFERYGIIADKVWAFGDLEVDTEGSYDVVRWGYHVAPVITITNADGTTTQMVIDPSIADGPITVDQWLAIMNTSTDEVNVQTTLEGQPPVHPLTGSPIGGSGYWPGDDPSIYGNSLTYYSLIVMETYGACGAAGSQCSPIEAFRK